jgi:glycosyltransferase involved in cell wall biosynthesis
MKIILSANTDWFLYNFRLNLARDLRGRGWEVVLLSPPGEFAPRLESAGFRWLSWDLGRKTTAPWRETPALREVARIYRAEKPDLVHHHTIKPSIYGSLAAAQAGVPGIVNSITGRGFVFMGGDLRVRAMRGLVERMYRAAFRPGNVRAIFENRTDREFFIERRLISRDRAHLVESVGVDAAAYLPSPEPEGVPVILMAARMLWDKGAGELVEAARLLGAPDRVRVALAGVPDPGNPNSIAPEQLSAWHAEGVVEYWGFREDMNAAIAGCHVFALPTKYAEGVPTSLLEASACARPIVSTRVPGAQDFVVDGETGLLVPPGDPVALAEALDRLVRDAALRGRMGAAGRARVLGNYTTGIVNERTREVYRGLLPEGQWS